MKHYNQSISSKAMLFAAITGISSVFGLTSCQQDDDDLYYSQSQTAQDCAKEAVANDSVLVNNYKFDYDNMGTTSASQYVADIDFGPKLNPIISRAAATTTTASAEDIIKQLPNILRTYDIASWDFFTVPIIRNLDRFNEKLRDVKDMALALRQNATGIDTKDYFDDYLFGFDDYNTNGKFFSNYLSLLKFKDKEAAYEVADAWAKREFRGTTAALAIRDLMVYITYFRTNSKTAPEMYDDMVFQTTPWEHQGYQKREQLRLADVAVVTSGYILARAHYEHQMEIAKKTENNYLFNSSTYRLRELNETYENFARLYENHAGFKRHDDKLICQIKGANIVFNKKLRIRDMYNHPWCHNNGGAFRILEEFMYDDMDEKRGGCICPTILLAKSLTQDEAEVIFNYYNPKDENNNYIHPVKNFDEIMKEVGFELAGLENGKKHVMTLNASCYQKAAQRFDLFDNGCYDYYFDKVIVSNNDQTFFKDWKLGRMKIKDREKTAGSDYYYIYINQWTDYSCNDCQFYYTDIRNRYSNMKPDAYGIYR